MNRGRRCPTTSLLARAYLSRVGRARHRVPAVGFVRPRRPVDAVAAIRAGRRRRTCSAATAARRAAADPEADLAAAERHGIRLVVPESRRVAALRDVRRWSAPARRAAAVRAPASDEARRVRASRCRRWRCGCGATPTSRRSGSRSVGIVGARASTAYGEHVDRRARRSGWRAVASAWSPAARTASTRRRIAARWLPAGHGRWCRRAASTARTRPGNADAVRARPPRRAAGLREPAGLCPAAAPVPHPQPADRRPVDRRGRGRGGRTLRRRQHREARRALGRPLMAVPGPGDVGDVGRLPRAAAAREPAGRCS